MALLYFLADGQRLLSDTGEMVFNFTGEAGLTPVPSAGATGQAGRAFHWTGGAGRICWIFVFQFPEKMPQVKYATLSFSKNLTGRAIAFGEEEIETFYLIKRLKSPASICSRLRSINHRRGDMAWQAGKC